MSSDKKPILYDVIDATPWPELTGAEDASAYVERVSGEIAQRAAAPIVEALEGVDR